MGSMRIIGHRGARGLAPENTLAGIARALAEGVDWVEFDIRRTRDGHLVVLHDRSTWRVARRAMRIRWSLLANIAQLQTRSHEPIPQLVEVLELIGARAKINIEVKSRGCGAQVAQAVQMMVAGGQTYDHFMISSFWPWILREVHRADPRIPLAQLEIWLPTHWLLGTRIRLAAIGFYHRGLTARMVHAAQKRGLFVYAHTVNKPQEAQHLQAMGVEGIVTDYPDRMHRAIRR